MQRRLVFLVSGVNVRARFQQKASGFSCPCLGGLVKSCIVKFSGGSGRIGTVFEKDRYDVRMVGSSG